MSNKLIQEICDKQHCLKAIEAMWLARFSDEKMMKLVRQNKGGTFQLGIAGHEMIGVVSAMSLQTGVDWALPYYRDRAFAIGLGCSLVDLFGAFWLGKFRTIRAGG